MSDPKLFIIEGGEVIDPVKYQQQEDERKIIRRSERKRQGETKLTYKPFERLAQWNSKHS